MQMRFLSRLFKGKKEITYMLTGKQKRHLRGLGSTEDPVLQIGKGGISDNSVAQAQEALEARELIKVKVLRNAVEEVSEAAEALAEATNAELVQVIGRNFLLYKRSEKKPKIELPQ
jgi:RNA-binding protein